MTVGGTPSVPGPRRAMAAVVAAAALVAAMPPTQAMRSPAGPPAVAAPHRIVSLVPAVTEMLFAIGAGDEVVGVSSFDHYPPEAASRPSVGALLDPDFERILSLRPDLVIVYATQRDLIERLTSVHVAMFPYEQAGLADITATIRTVGHRVGHDAGANQVAGDIERRVANLRAKTAGLARPRTMIVFEREPGTLRGMYASGNVGFLADMLDVAGGVNVFADVKQQSLQVTSELVLARAPDVIVEIDSGPGWTADRVAHERRVWSGLSSVPAVRTGRIYLLTADLMSIPGPRVIQAITAIAQVLHPEVFPRPGA